MNRALAVAIGALCAAPTLACGARSGVALRGTTRPDRGGSAGHAGIGSAGAGGGTPSCQDCPDLPAPRLVAPLSTATVTSRRPTLRWEPPAGADGVHISICADRPCEHVLAEFDASGASARPDTDLPAGVRYWRAVATLGSRPSRNPSATWQFTVESRSAPVDTSWGTTLDVNGDGRADVLVGAYGADDRAGQATLYRGSSEFVDPDSAATLHAPDGPTAYFSLSLASAGDVNGDGFADVVVGAYAVNDEEGRAYVYLGGASGIATSPVRTLVGPDGQGGFFGVSVASAGDVNGDGYADIAVGADRATAHAGRVHVFYGGPSGPSHAPNVSLDGDVGSVGHFGITVASAGDVNGDGYGDLLVGAPAIDRAYVYLGSANGIGRTPAEILTGPDAPVPGWSSVFGHGLGAGDLDGDGLADLIIAGFPGATSFQGRVYVYPGSASALPSEPSVTLSFPRTDDRHSVALASSIDIDGDGYQDLVAGLPGSEQVLAFAGGPSGVNLAPMTRIVAPDSHYFGAAVSSGDVDGDGHADITASAYGGPSLLANDPYTGRVYVYSGSAGGLSLEPVATLIGDAGQASYYGFSLAALSMPACERELSVSCSAGASVGSSRWE